MTPREPVFKALFELAESIKWELDGTERTWVTTGRRVKLFSDVTSSQQPAIFQAEHLEASSQVTRMPYKRTWEASWIIYRHSSDPNEVPAIETNLILDAVEKAMAPKPSDIGFLDERNTLGGLVHHCFIDGTLFKDPGDIDDQGMIVVPIRLLVP